MTIQNTTIRKAGPSQGNGVTTVFPFTFKVFTATDILVTYLDTSGVESALVLTTNYTVSLNADQNTSPGGSVTLLVAPATATYITLTSQVTNTQNLALTNSGGFYPESINNALDRTVIEIQQLAEQASRSITIPKSSTASPLLPIPAANNVLVWNNAATALINLPATTGTSLVDLTSSIGSTLVGTTNEATGAVTRTVASKLSDFINVKDFGATGDGGTDDTVAIQNALTAARINGTIYFPAGAYHVTATIIGLGNQTIRGAGANSTIITRSGDYGDTFVFGNASTACGHVRFYDIWMMHGVTMYTPGDTSLANLATTGAHIRMWGCQEPILSNVWLWRLPFQFVIEGGSLAIIEKCHFYGIWDSLYPAAQEGVAQVLLRSSALGIVTSTKIRDCFFTGNGSLARNTTFTPSTGDVVKSITDPVGSQYGLKIDCSEDLDMTGCYLSAHSHNSVLVDNTSADPAFELRFANNFFDVAKYYSIQISSISAESSYINITGNTFNGEGTGIGAISISQSAGTWVCHSSTIANNNFLAHIGTPLLASGLYFSNVSSNTFTSYNFQNVTPSDPSWCSALYITSPSANITVNGNEVGYGLYCYLGVSIGSGATGIQQYGNAYLSTANNSILDFGKLVMPNDGRLYGTALHNNASAITGTTNQYIASGTYTPSLTALSNVTSSVVAVCQYMRVGNVVTVSGRINVTPTATATTSNFLLSLPIASTIANTSNLGGTGAFDTNAVINSVSIIGNVGNNKAYFQFISSGTSSTPLAFSFTYVIL